MRTVISVIDLQSDLERERSRCALKGDPDKTGFSRYRSASCWTADLEVPDWGFPSVLNAVTAAPPSLRSSPHVTAASASHHELTSCGVIGRDWVGCATGGAHRVPRRCGRPIACGLVGHEMLLDDGAEGVRTFSGFER